MTEAQRRPFGSVRQLPGGRYQARYTVKGKGYRAPTTFGQRRQAERHLERVRLQLDDGTWIPPDELARLQAEGQTFGAYAERWLKHRGLKPRTRILYDNILERDILPTFADVVLDAITVPMVVRWHDDLPADKPTRRAHAYSLLRTILGTAVESDLIEVNPARIRGASTAKRQRKIRPASVAELEVIVATMPEKYRAAVWLSAWCALRFGELAELRRWDLDLDAMVLRVERAVTTRDGQTFVGTPKSEAGTRDVAIPPHLRGVLLQHLDDHAQEGPAGLVFPAADGVSHLAPSTLYKPFSRARKAAGRPDLRWHDLRHTGAVLAAATGATLADLMGRLGHSSASAALRYQHTVSGRDAEIARKLSALSGHDEE